MLIALQCVSLRNNDLYRRMQKDVRNAIRLAAKFLKSPLHDVTTHNMDSAWIGNKYSSPLALLALKAVDRSFIYRKEK